MKSKLCFASPHITTVKLDDAVFQFKARESWLQGLFVKHLCIEVPIGEIGWLDQFFIGHRFFATIFRAPLKNRQEVGTFRNQRCCDTCFVVDLNQKRSPPLLDQFFLRWSFHHRNPAFRIDTDRHETKWVE